MRTPGELSVVAGVAGVFGKYRELAENPRRKLINGSEHFHAHSGAVSKPWILQVSSYVLYTKRKCADTMMYLVPAGPAGSAPLELRSGNSYGKAVGMRIGYLKHELAVSLTPVH